MTIMIKEDKELLLQDLCARLPYGVICKDDYAKIEGKLSQIGINYDMCVLSDVYGKTEWAYIPNCKPYLFPLSSMTEEQKQEYSYIVNYISPDDTENWKESEFIYVEQFTQLMHFYHINHLDYRGLIPIGLAIDATGLNIY